MFVKDKFIRGPLNNKIYNCMEELNNDYLKLLADRAMELFEEQRNIVDYAFLNRSEILQKLEETNK